MSNKFKIIPLVYPIPVPVEGQQGKTVDVSELKLGRIKAKHLRLLPSDFSEKEGKLEPNAIIPLIAGLANIPESSVDEIDIEDLMTIAEGLESFLEKFLKDGEK